MFRYYFTPLFWALTILFFSSIPSKELPDISFWRIFTFDKMAHIALYGIFSFQIMRTCIRQYARWNIRYHAASIAAVVSILYGAGIELMQHYLIADRYGDWLDFVANIIGTFTGILLFKKIFYQYIR